MGSPDPLEANQAILFVAASDIDSNLYYASRFHAGDPIVYLEHDGRRKLVQLTKKGDRLMNELFLKINKLEREFVSELKQGELAELSRMLRIVLHTPEHLS